MNSKTKPLHVLMADDDPFITSLYRDILIRSDVRVDTVQNGEEALKFLQSTVPDLLVLDINMPRIDGSAVLRYIREQSSCPDLPVIVLSNVCSEEFVERINRLRPSRFLIKYDYPPNRVVQTIMEVLDTLRKGETVPATQPTISPAPQPAAPGSMPDLLQHLEQTSSIEEQRSILLEIYRIIQPALRTLGGANPLSMAFQFGCSAEQCFEQWYARESLLSPWARRLLCTVETSAEYWNQRINEGAAMSALLLISNEEDEQRRLQRGMLERPGWTPLVVAREDSALDIIEGNSISLIVWRAKRFGAARKILKRIRELERVSQMKVLFLLPEQDADQWLEEIYDTKAFALPHEVSAPELLAAVYGEWRLMPTHPV